MALELIPCWEPDADCFTNCMRTIANNWNITTELLYLNKWDLIYVCQGDLISEKIRTNDNYNHLVYQGIKIDNNENENVQDFLTRYYEENDNVFYIMFLDSFYCPWCLSYQKNHYYHTVILTNVTPESIQCLDLFYTYNFEQLSYSQLAECFITYCIVRKVNKKSLSIKEYIHLLLKQLNSQKERENNIEESFSLHINDLKNIELLDMDLNIEKDVDINPLIFRTKILTYNRKCFIEFLCHFSNATDVNVDCFRESLRSICDNWERYRMTLIKYNLIRSKKTHDAILRLFEDISQQEVCLFNNFISFLENELRNNTNSEHD